MRDLDELGHAVVMAAYRAAWSYLETHKLAADTDALAAALSAHCRARIPEALADAKVALASNLDAIAEQTFIASFALAGIEAAKEVGR